MIGLLKIVSFPLRARAVSLVLLFLSSLSYGQNDNAVEQQNRRENLQQRIIELEAAVGRYDPTLVEDLTSLADSATTLNLYTEARSVLDRAIQIQRYNLGLHTPEQIPLYFELIENDINIGNWAVVNESLDYLYWLLLEKRAVSEETIVDNLIRLSEFHLLGVADDVESQQAGHFRKAEELTYLALEISEFYWGPSDLRRVDLYYSLIKQFYLQYSAIERGGEAGYALRAVVPGSDWVRPARIVQSRYYRAGLRLLSDMREILAESSDNPSEFLAMVDLYRADWHLLFNENRAESVYKEAADALLEAGLETDEVDRLFSQPQILPIPVFYASVEQAVAAAESGESIKPALEPTLASSDTSADFHFADWFDFMPIVPFPVTAPAVVQSQSSGNTDFWLQFRLNSLEKVSSWVRGTYQTHLGVVEEFDVLGDRDYDAIDLQYLNQRLHYLHFRPRLENGVATPFEGTLLFRAAIATD